MLLGILASAIKIAAGGANPAADYASYVNGLTPIAYWRFEETSGSVAADETGNYDLNLSGTYTLAQDGILSTSGIDVTFGEGNPSATPLQTISAFSYVGWIRADDETTNQYILGRGNNHDIIYGFVDGVMELFNGASDTMRTESALNVPNDGEYHFFAYSYDGTNFIAKLDAFENITTFSQSVLNASDFVLFSSTGGTQSDCKADEIAIFDKALTIEEIREIYRRGLNLSEFDQAVLSTSPLHYWRMLQDSSNVPDEVNSNPLVHGSNPTAVSGLLSDGALNYAGSAYSTSQNNVSDIGNSWSYAALFKVNQRYDTVPVTICGFGDVNISSRLELRNNDLVHFRNGNQIIANDWQFDVWYWATCVYDDTNGYLAFYIGDQLIGIQDQSIGPSSNIFSVMQQPFDSVATTEDITIDEVAFWDRALRQDEIKEIYATIKPADFDTAINDLPVVNYWKLDETSGTTANDSVGVDNGTYVGSPTLNQSPILENLNNCVSFDQTDDEIQFATINVDGLNDKTLIAAVRFDDVSLEHMVVKEGGSSNGFGLGISGTDLMVGINSTGTPSGASYPVSNLQNSLPHLLIATIDSLDNRFRLYIDGQLAVVSTPTISSHDGNCEFMIGSTWCPAQGNYQNPLTGIQEELRMLGEISNVAVLDQAIDEATARLLYKLAAGQERWSSVLKNVDIIISNDGLTQDKTGAASWRAGASRTSRSSGKLYWEIDYTDPNADPRSSVGISTKDLNFLNYIGVDTESYGWLFNNEVRFNGSGVQNYGINAPVNGDTIMFAIDFDNGDMWVGRNGTWEGTGDPDNLTNPVVNGIAVDDWYIAASQRDTGETFTLKTRASDMSHTIPSGFTAWAEG